MKNAAIAKFLGKQPLFSPRVVVSADNDEPATNKKDPDPWKIIVADDDASVHDVTLLLLRTFMFEDKSLEILDAYTGKEALKLLQDNPDTAVLLLDVVMEEEDSGLQVVQKIREQIKNSYVRIILRTGQPGQAPESEVISKYDINDYRDKSELTAQRLFSCVTAALRSYRDIKKIEKLAMSKETLEKMVNDRTKEIMDVNVKLKEEVTQRRIINDALEKSEHHLSDAQQLTNVGSWELELDSKEIKWSEQMYRIIGSSECINTLKPTNIIEYVPADEKEFVRAALDTGIKEGGFDIEHKLKRINGKILMVRHKGVLICDKSGEPVRLSSVVQDISEKYRTEEQMRKLSSAVQQIADSVMITDVNGKIEYVNNAFVEMTGYEGSEVLGKKSNFLRSDQHDAIFYEELWKTIKNGEIYNNIFISRKKCGEVYHEVKTITPLKNHKGEITHFISSAKDITERMIVQKRLEHMAHHDALTGLPNRVLLKDRLNQVLSRKKWNNRVAAVLFLDLDRFKTINDTLGHDVGDDLLCEVANKLQTCIREGDTVARLGGDEFAIILNDVARQEDIDRVGKKIINIMQKPVTIKGHVLHVTTSIGISRCPGDANSVESLLKNADVALYKAKSMGRNNFRYYSKSDRNRAANRFKLENCLREAVDKEQFSLVYQPQINVSSKIISGVEALLRCEHEYLKGVSPAEFINVLEDTGLILPVGEWVLRKACLDAKNHGQAGGSDYSVAVNLSIRQFLDKSLIKIVESALSESGLAPERLELEITESLLIEHINETAGILQEINDMGVRLSIDDFGTGYSSLNYLKRLPLDTLKIDRSFVCEADTNDDDAAITKAIITLGHSMGLQVVAEGVERMSHFDFLQDNLCDTIQGYLISKPVSHSQLIDFMDNMEKKSVLDVVQSGFSTKK